LPSQLLLGARTKDPKAILGYMPSFENAGFLKLTSQQWGHLLEIDCCNMLYICIVESYTASFLSLAWKLGLHPSILAGLSKSYSNLTK
jgi:hypothetical protein